MNKRCIDTFRFSPDLFDLIERFSRRAHCTLRESRLKIGKRWVKAGSRNVLFIHL